MKKWLKITGYGILILSGICWGLILAVPWLGFSKKALLGLMSALIIVGEITFYLGLALAGKSIYDKIKNKLMFWKKKKVDNNPDQEEKPENKVDL